MSSIKKTARVAGVLYLLFVFAGLFSLMYVPGKLIVRGNASETADRILAHQTLLQTDLAVGLITVVLFVLIALALYQLLKDVNRQYATLMVILILIQLPQSFVSQLLQIGAVELVRGADFLSVIDKPQRETLAMLCLHLNDKSAVLSEFFWGLWLFPLGALVFRSGFLPRFLGIWLILNGVAYVAMCLTGLFLPQYAAVVYKVALPTLFGEVALMVGLLVIGFRPNPQPDLSPARMGG
jgi:hypothetical protein